MAFIRKFKTSAGAIGVQVLYKEHGEIVKTIHVGSANSEWKLEKLERKAREIINGGQDTLFDLSNFDGEKIDNRETDEVE